MAKGFPLEGKLSPKVTDEVSPMRIGSYFDRKSIADLLFENCNSLWCHLIRPSQATLSRSLPLPA